MESWWAEDPSAPLQGSSAVVTVWSQCHECLKIPPGLQCVSLTPLLTSSLLLLPLALEEGP